MSIHAFIDGQEGTTGLQLRERLARHPDVTLMEIHPAARKDPAERARLINGSDVTFLCLPDGAAKEALALVQNPAVRIIDASTAHRTAPGWAYGFPELSPGHRRAVAQGKRIANPGCHATGFLAAAYPLVALSIVGKDYPFTCHSVTGYSGGGKKMIGDYEGAERDQSLDSPRQYGLTQAHKHLPEMQKTPGLTHPPVFNPIVADYYSGMAVSVPLTSRLMQRQLTRGALQEALADYYADCPLITVPDAPEEGFIAANHRANRPGLALYVLGSDESMTLVSLFDNLDKGASGAAVQNMNIAFGLPETTSLGLDQLQQG